MAVEKGIRLGTMTLAGLEKSGGLAAALRRFRRFYLGPEFCENLLDESVCGEAAWLQERGKKICLLTPMLSEAGVERLEAVFERLSGLVKRGAIDPAGLEITVNDFGAVELARRRGLPFTLNAGRLLRDNVFDSTGKPLKVHNGAALKFFRGLGIKRYELPSTGALPEVNFSDGARYGFDREDFRLTLYYPYLDLTSTRTCPVGMRGAAAGEAARGVNCGRECRIGYFKLAHPGIKEKLLVRGNTVFLGFPSMAYASAENLEKMNVDRLVYEPFP